MQVYIYVICDTVIIYVGIKLYTYLCGDSPLASKS